MTNVSYYDALEYAERTGSRLPTMDEYVFAATNRGTTRFPWGDDGEPIEDWQVDRPQPPNFDVTLDPPGIRGLYSRVAEWTQTGSAGNLPDGLRLEASRLIAGDSELVEGAPVVRENDRISARVFVFERLNSFGKNGLGFRCVRSIQPRFFEPPENPEN